MIEEVTTLFHC